MKTGNRRDRVARPFASKDGMTLLEVLIASCLSVLLIAGIFGAIQNADRGACMASQYVAAFERARELVEDMRGAPYENVTTNNYLAETNLFLTNVIGSQTNHIYCNRTSTISNAIPASPQGQDVRVTVQWVYRIYHDLQ